MKVALRKEIKRFTGIGVGVIIESLSYALLLVPNRIAPGGLTAVAIIINSVTGLPVGLSYFLFNLPFLGLAWKKMGKKYVLRTFIISFISFIFTDVFIYLINRFFGKPLSTDLLVAAVIGGIINGLGIGTTFKNRASAGGTDLISQVIHYYTGLQFGQIVLIVDSTVIVGLSLYFGISQGFNYGLNLFIYALIALVVSSFVIDAVQEGISNTKCMTVVTERTDELKENLLTKLGRGFTFIKAVGGFTGKEKSILIMAIVRSQISHAKQIVLETDPKAFVMVGPLNEVVGEGFKNPQMEEW